MAFGTLLICLPLDWACLEWKLVSTGVGSGVGESSINVSSIPLGLNSQKQMSPLTQEGEQSCLNISFVLDSCPWPGQEQSSQSHVFMTLGRLCYSSIQNPPLAYLVSQSQSKVLAMADKAQCDLPALPPHLSLGLLSLLTHCCHVGLSLFLIPSAGP